MSTETKETIQNLIYYYDHHSIEEFVKGENRLQSFVIEDFTKLLDLVRTEVFND